MRAEYIPKLGIEYSIEGGAELGVGSGRRVQVEHLLRASGLIGVAEEVVTTASQHTDSVLRACPPTRHPANPPENRLCTDSSINSQYSSFQSMFQLLKKTIIIPNLLSDTTLSLSLCDEPIPSP